ncbi:MAG: minichromosome maintenance protein MCM [Burkholderiaceae bacterium]|nr:minichromosome maintenance protein MCM [Burkholderiaceae bacterium]
MYHSDDIKQIIETGKRGTLHADYFELESFIEAHTYQEMTVNLINTIIKEAETILNTKTSHRINFRLIDMPHNTLLHDLDTEHIGKFISTAAMIKNITRIKARIKDATFECRGCMQITTSGQKEAEAMVEPALCRSCGGRSFRLLPEESSFVNYRYVKLEEPLELRRFGVTRDFIAYLEDDLATPNSNIKPGDVVDVTGLFQVVEDDKTREWQFLINSHNITSKNSSFDDMDLSDEDKNEILDLSQKENIFQLFINSIAPNVYGYENVKAGIVLQLFEGNKPEEDTIGDRWVIHILIIGDPGIGKSKLVQEVSSTAPKGISVSGTGSTEVGLTASAIKDELTGKWAMEAGAIVLADSGILSIDEFDKLSKRTMKSLNEPMEQLTVSTAKAGLVQTMSARTSVLAAANPKYSKFDRYKSIKDQIDIPESTLSRFDLVYAMEDIIDEKEDKELAMKLLKGNIEDTSLETIEPGLLQKYIAYAKSEYRPVMSEEANHEIVNFYVSTRQAAIGNEDSKPITPRDMKAIERLSIARAKLELREYVTKEDAIEAINIFRAALKTVGLEPDTAGDLRGVKSDKEIDLLKRAEKLIKDNMGLYGSKLSSNAVNDIRDELLVLCGGRADTVDDVFKEAMSNIKNSDV